MTNLTTRLFDTSEPYNPVANLMLITPPTGEDYKRDIAVRCYEPKALTPDDLAKRIDSATVTPSNFEPDYIDNLNYKESASLNQPIGLEAMLKTHRDNIGGFGFDLRERFEARSQDCIARQIDCEVFKTLNRMCPRDHRLNCDTLIPESILLALSLIEDHEITPGGVFLHPAGLRALKADADGHPTMTLFRRPKGGGHCGWIDVTPIHCCTMIPKNAVVVLAEPNFVGALHVEKPYAIEEFSDHQDIGWVARKTIRVDVMNDYAQAWVIYGNPRKTQPKPKKQGYKNRTRRS